MKIKLSANGILLAFVILLLFNCVSSKEFDGNLNNIGSDIIIVGSFELEPPMAGDEQYFGSTTVNAEAMINDIYFVIDREACNGCVANLSNAGKYANIELGETFFVRQQNGERFFISGLFMYKEQKVTHMEYLNFPGPFEFRIPTGARAVYVGNIIFHRDIYNTITKIEITDEYDKALTAMEKKFGWKMQMQIKPLLHSMNMNMMVARCV